MVALTHLVPKRKEQEQVKKKATNQNDESEPHPPKEHNATNLETNRLPQPSPNLPPEHSNLLPQTWNEKKEKTSWVWGKSTKEKEGKEQGEGSKPWTIPFLSDDPFEWKKGIQLILHHEFLKNVKGFHWWEQDVGMDDVLFWWLIDQLHSLEDDVEFAVLHSLFEEWFAELCCLLVVCDCSEGGQVPIRSNWRKRFRAGWTHSFLEDPVDGWTRWTSDRVQGFERLLFHFPQC